MSKKAAIIWMVPLFLIGMASCDKTGPCNPCKMNYSGMTNNNSQGPKKMYQDRDKMMRDRDRMNQERRMKSDDNMNSNPNNSYRKNRGCRTCKSPVYDNMNEDCCRVCPPKRIYSCRPCKGERNKPPRPPECRVCEPKDCPDRLECRPCQ